MRRTLQQHQRSACFESEDVCFSQGIIIQQYILGTCSGTNSLGFGGEVNSVQSSPALWSSFMGRWSGHVRSRSCLIHQQQTAGQANRQHCSFVPELDSPILGRGSLTAQRCCATGQYLRASSITYAQDSTPASCCQSIFPEFSQTSKWFSRRKKKKRERRFDHVGCFTASGCGGRHSPDSL